MVGFHLKGFVKLTNLCGMLACGEMIDDMGFGMHAFRPDGRAARVPGAACGIGAATAGARIASNPVDGRVLHVHGGLPAYMGKQP